MAARARLPYINLSDVPELLPGARPSATPAQREEFEQQCKKLYMEEVQRGRAEAAAREEGAVASGAGRGLEPMFPTLDGALVRALVAEAPSAQHAIETLLRLSASEAALASAEPSGEDGHDVSLGAHSLCFEDPSIFPVLVDSDGWQVASRQVLGEDSDRGFDAQSRCGSWSSRAKAVCDLPQQLECPASKKALPKATSEPPQVAPILAGARREELEDEAAWAPVPLTDYDLRHQLGRQRACERAGRRGRAGGMARAAAGRGASGAGAVLAARRAPGSVCSPGTESDSEASSCLSPLAAT